MCLSSCSRLHIQTGYKIKIVFEAFLELSKYKVYSNTRIVENLEFLKSVRDGGDRFPLHVIYN